jgi:hypothetical protein
MSRKERVIAGLLLVVAVGGGALIPRLLATSATPLGIALGRGPTPGVVQAPTIPKAIQHTAGRTTSPPPAAVAAPITPVAPIVVRPTPAAGVRRPQPPSATPTTPPAATVPPSPAPSLPPTQPPAAADRQPPSSVTPPGQAKTPPGQAKKLRKFGETPPGHVKTPPGHTKMPPAPGPPSPAETGAKAGWRNAARDLPGSWHGRSVSQAPSYPVGAHHRSVGHLASPAARPAPATRASSPQARSQDRGRRGQGSERPSPPPVTHGHGHNGNGNSRSD